MVAKSVDVAARQIFSSVFFLGSVPISSLLLCFGTSLGFGPVSFLVSNLGFAFLVQLVYLQLLHASAPQQTVLSPWLNIFTGQAHKLPFAIPYLPVIS